ASWNKTLQQRLSDQLAEIERVSRLKRFLAPQVVDLILSSGDERVSECHRGDMSVVFCDLREYTRFAEATAPEEVMAALREYNQSLDGRIHRRGGTLDRFSGDGLMGPFNDPQPCPDPAMKARRMAVEMRDVVAKLHYGPELGSDRHRARVCHPRADRLRGPIRLFRHWEPWSISRRDYV